jgi:nitroreductase
LMAHALGLGASGMTGPLLAEPALRSILEVPDGWGIVALVPIGWPAEDPASTDRKPVDKVVRWL